MLLVPLVINLFERNCNLQPFYFIWKRGPLVHFQKEDCNSYTSVEGHGSLVLHNPGIVTLLYVIWFRTVHNSSTVCYLEADCNSWTLSWRDYNSFEHYLEGIITLEHYLEGIITLEHYLEGIITLEHYLEGIITLEHYLKTVLTLKWV